MDFVNDWGQTRSEIISMALRIIGVLPTGEDTSSDFVINQTAEATAALLMILASLQNESMSPFKRQVLTAPLVASSTVTGSDSLVYTATSTHTTPNTSSWASSMAFTKGALIFPTVRAGYYYQAQNAGTSGASEPTFIAAPSVTVTDNTITWLSYPDTKPITGAANLQYWEQTGASGSVYTQNKEYRAICDVKLNPNTIAVLKVWYRESTQNDTVLQTMSKSEYEGIEDKTYSGMPTHCYFNDSFSPTLHLYPSPNSTSIVIMYEALTGFNDMDLGSDTGITTQNFKNRWIQYIVYALAEHLGEEYQIPDGKMARLAAKAEQYKRGAMARDYSSFHSEYLDGAY